MVAEALDRILWRTRFGRQWPLNQQIPGDFSLGQRPGHEEEQSLTAGVKAAFPISFHRIVRDQFAEYKCNCYLFFCILTEIKQP
jgi:hypothetical protein